MPANLNALIRYRTIDQCLINKYVPCNIERLQEACADALGESRGRYETVSKRTIYDDLRVMRSDILGFNAPIVCLNGVYSYENDDYSIFDVKIQNIDLLKKVAFFLLDNKDKLNQPEFKDIIIEIDYIVSKEINSPFLTNKEIEQYVEDTKEVDFISNQEKKSDDYPELMFRFRVNEENTSNEFTWSRILSLLQ